ncbi:AAEL014745-PA [Aedes aegypti]|uniref:AAEL014745-PA n=1 Tax=Aedes aegypti TaxID=7159 RepID=Q16FI5_AEDAE|nr:AAEL014745-PA [Aedes aegypti]
MQPKQGPVSKPLITISTHAEETTWYFTATTTGFPSPKFMPFAESIHVARAKRTTGKTKLSCPRHNP